MTKMPIKAVEMIRTIRDKHADELRSATPEERIAFYRKKARQTQTVAPDQEVERKAA